MTGRRGTDTLEDLLVWLVALAVSGCTLLSDFEVHQCDVDADCDAPSGATRRCERFQCVQGCTDNSHCAAVDPRHPLCQHRGGACVGLTSAGGECYTSAGYDETSMGERTLEDMIVLGAFAPTVRSSTWLTLELAVNELNSLGGLPSRSGVEPVLAVLCEDEITAADAVMDHLVADLHVPAILASLDDEPLHVALERPGTKGLALFLSPNGASLASAASQDTDGLLWYLGPDSRDVLAGYAPLVRSAAAAFAARGVGVERLRIANLESGAGEDQALSAAVRAVIELGGKGAVELELEDRFRTFRVPDALPSRLRELVDYGPDIVLGFAGGSFAESPYRPRASLIENLELQVEGGVPWRPTFILGPRNVSETVLASLAAGNLAFRSHAVGVRSDRPIDKAIATPIVSRFRAAYPRAAAPELDLEPSLSVYDAFYYLAYATAAAAAAGQPRDLERVLGGLARVTDAGSESVNVGLGPEGLERAIPLLERRAAFNLHGTTGAADFDTAQRVRPGRMRAYCWGDDGWTVDLGTYDGTDADFTPLATACGREAVDVEGN